MSHARSDIEANLYELGLLGHKPRKPSKSSGAVDGKRHRHVESKTSLGSDKHRTGSRSSNRTDEYHKSRAQPQSSSSRSGTAHSGRPPQRNMASVLDLERSRTRRERTFIGTECSVCEEPLEHTLRGEKVLQLSCGHVAHEACFYAYIREFESQYCPTCNAPLALDTSRGGNVLDLGRCRNDFGAGNTTNYISEKLSGFVRSTPVNDVPAQARSNTATPTPWEPSHTPQPEHRPTHAHNMSYNDHGSDTQRHHQREGSRNGVHGQAKSDRTGSVSRQHMRNDSGATGVASSADYADPQLNQTTRSHPYDLHSMESALASPRTVVKNPIPAPMVTVRSEFPTISRSRAQQSITCLVTVEVTEGKWKPNLDDIRTVPPMPSLNGSQYERAKSPTRAPSQQQQRFETPYENEQVMEEITADLHSRVDNWHGLVFSRFGKLRLHGHVRVGKDRQSWQELECYLFTEMLICVKEKKMPPQQFDQPESSTKKPRCTLKGSILIKKHLKQVDSSADGCILTLSLSVAELPSFHLQFQNRGQLEQWRRALLDINSDVPQRMQDFDNDNSGTDEDDYQRNSRSKRVSSVTSSYGGQARSTATAPTEYTNPRKGSIDHHIPTSIHVPIDIVVVIPVTSAMGPVKISLIRDTLRFLVSNLGERDRMGLVTFGSSGGGVPQVGMTSKTWKDWPKILDSIRAVGQKSLRADVVEGANVAMDLLMQRKSTNPLSSILLISDSSVADTESVDFVVSRAEAAKVTIHSFGLGLTHKPDTMIELSTRTKASYTYVKDWMTLRECIAGCLGALQTTSHQNVKLKLRLPEGSPAKFIKISGALHITKRATGRDAEASLGDLRFGDKRDILVQLAIAPDTGSPEQVPQDAWETVISGLEALGGPMDPEEPRSLSVEEVPLLQADLVYGDILREGTTSHLPRPSLLAITMLPSPSKHRSIARPMTPPIPPHPHVVQRRMELLTSDMLTRALTLVSRGQHERAQHLLRETRSILKGLGKGGLPPLPHPPPSSGLPKLPPTPKEGASNNSPTASDSERPREPSPRPEHPFSPVATGIDAAVMAALDAELESGLEWINHPAIFGRDSRKAVLQAIGVISSQRGYTFRTPSESLWAERIAGIKKLTERHREWREAGDDALTEEQ